MFWRVGARKKISYSQNYTLGFLSASPHCYFTAAAAAAGGDERKYAAERETTPLKDTSVVPFRSFTENTFAMQSDSPAEGGGIEKRLHRWLCLTVSVAEELRQVNPPVIKSEAAPFSREAFSAMPSGCATHSARDKY